MVAFAALVKRRAMGDNVAHYVGRPVNVTCEADNDEPTMGRPVEENLSELVRRGVQGDERALEGIYDRFKYPVFNLAYRYTGDAAAAEDLLQDVFLTAFTRLGDLNEAASFQSWLFKIAVNSCLGHLRSRKAERRSSVSLSEIEDVAAAVSVREPAHTLCRSLEQAVQALPERLKMVFLLHDVEGFKHEEIAGILRCSVGTSKSHLFKARVRLRDRLAKAGVRMGGESTLASSGRRNGNFGE
jgi:RNA polymerase sigma-70 factor (ECF subfamily)